MKISAIAVALFLAGAVAFPGCIQIGPVPDSGPGGGLSSASDAGAAGSSSTTTASTTGAGCGTDVLTGVALCAAASACPGLVIDREIYPHCGFRVPSTTIQLECICGDYLCSMGTVLDCDQAAKLLAWQTEVSVCAQLDYDRCALRAKKPTGATCNPTCRMGCTGDPTCVTQCGC